MKAVIRARKDNSRSAGVLFALAGGCLMLAVAALAAPRGESGQDGWMAEQRGPAGKDLNAVHFSDSKRGWAAGDDGIVMHTEDGGKTWVRQPVDTTESINDIYFRDKEDGYLLAGNRVFKSEDSGRTWREVARFPPALFEGATPELYSVRFAGKKKGWIVGSVSRREAVVDSLVMFTEDGGTTWRRLRVPTRGELIHLDFSNDRRGWVVGAGGRILHTQDGGMTWAQQRSGTSATLYHIDFRNEDDGWTVGERGTILRTTDGGATWSPVKAPVRSTLLSVKFASDKEGWIVGRGGVILRSEDGGQTWAPQPGNRTKENLYALFVEKKNGWAVGGNGVVMQYER